jgi:hypothetical protein
MSGDKLKNSQGGHQMTTQPEGKVYPPSEDVIARAHVDATKYEEMYAASIADPEAFWGEQGKRIDWIKPLHDGEGRKLQLRRGFDQLVCGRHTERIGQLHRPSS